MTERLPALAPAPSPASMALLFEEPSQELETQELEIGGRAELISSGLAEQRYASQDPNNVLPSAPAGDSWGRELTHVGTASLATRALLGRVAAALQEWQGQGSSAASEATVASASRLHHDSEYPGRSY